jgi:phosphatidylglycerophosphate synthase
VGRYRARDLVNAPTLVSLVRVPLAVAFPFVQGRTSLAFLVLATAGLSDVVDGWIARRYRLATPTGAVVDGVTDKTFAAVVLVTLVVTGRLTLLEVVLLGAREIGELPLVLWILLSGPARRRKSEDRANVFGKAATTFQFFVVGAALLGSPLRATGVWLAAMLGSAAALSYWLRATTRAREPA